MREAANAAQLKRNFAGSPLLYVPEVYWDYCRVDVMVMERIHGVPISDMARAARRGRGHSEARAERRGDLLHAGVPPQLLPRGHAPRQHLRALDDPQNPRYAAVDFGIVGTLDPRDQHYLAENFLAVFDRDYRRVAVLHVESGWVPPDTRVDEMESAIRTVCEPIFDKPHQGHLLRHAAAAAVRDLAPLQHGSAAAADPAAEDAAQHRRAGARPVSGSRHLEHREPDPARLDARARERAHRVREPAQAMAGAARGRARTCRRCSRAACSAPSTARSVCRSSRRRSQS